jgi:hypothetical protein
MQNKPSYSTTRIESFDDIIEMFKQLAGRDPTPEELAEARAEWDGANEESGK